ncbi:uncharacterized protein LOC122932142 [Bufo gargarizans]|uniref:uncharacterized protein LOC122926541 n=1 Tax=Bufo gargarizans TaxID=30331 RepID=UPI001CF4D784|nr:uncharacterized protein LOC122926541 [Bufo gargarizans]XP_044142325.1 uncharacterized protein LOC122932142 [Bufo gargarizans]
MSQPSDIEEFVSLPPSPRGSEHGSTPSLRAWTVPRLTAELLRRGIPFAATARKAELFSLLFPATPQARPAASGGNTTISNSLVQIHAVLNTLTSSIQDLQARMEVMEQRRDPPPAVGPAGGAAPPAVVTGTVPTLRSTANLSQGGGVPSVAPVYFVRPSIKKDILEGKDVNLASLLITSHDVTENKSFGCSELSVVLKAKDPRLSRKLTLAEFVLAFSLFRDVVCSASPNRREELDIYLYRVVDLAHKYGGTAFYDYHRSFSAKAAAIWAQFQVVTDWSNIDMELFCRHFASLKSPVCATCQSPAHTTAWCPLADLTAAPSTSRGGINPGPSQQATQFDKLGRPIHYLGKAQLCNNFNYAVCNFSQCRLLHICATCFRAHPVTVCTVKPA